MSSFIGLMFLFGFGSTMGLPLGIPPLPEDPVLARIAPDDCLMYWSWAGMAAPDPKSGNRMEQLLAEPEVRRFFAKLDRQLQSSLRKTCATKEEEAVPTIDMADWGKVFLTRPAALFLRNVSIAESAQGGFVVHVGPHAAKLKTWLDGCRVRLARGPAKVTDVEVGGATWRRVEYDSDRPAVTWGMKGEYFVIGVGPDVVEGILQRWDGKPPAWLAEVRKQLPVDRPTSVAYVNIRAIYSLTFKELGPQRAAGVRALRESFGLANVDSLSTVSGLDKEGFVIRTLLATDGEPRGVFAVASGKPLTPADLAAVPADATLAVVSRVKAQQASKIIKDVAHKTGLGSRSGWSELLGAMELDWDKDVVMPLGDRWCVYGTLNEASLFPLSATAVISLKDSKRMQKTVGALVARLRRMGIELQPDGADAETDDARANRDEDAARAADGDHPPPRVEHFSCAGQKVSFVNPRTGQAAVAPAWCVTEKELLVALSPQDIEAHLSRKAGAKSLADMPAVRELFRDGRQPLAVAYCDTPRVFDIGCLLAPPLLREVSDRLSDAGFDLSALPLPAAATVRKHLRPTTLAVYRTKAGLECTSRRSIPGVNALATAPAMACVLLSEAWRENFYAPSADDPPEPDEEGAAEER